MSALTSWDTVLGAIAASAQFLAGWLGWQVTVRPVAKHDSKRQLRYKLLFLGAGILGFAASIGAAIRAQSAADKLETALGLRHANLIPTNQDGYLFTPTVQVAGQKLQANLSKRNTGLSDAIVKHFDLVETYDASQPIEDVCPSLEQHLFDFAQSGTPAKTVVSAGEDFIITFSGRTLTKDDADRIKDGSLAVFIATLYTYKDPDGRNFAIWRTRKRISGNAGECGGQPWNLNWGPINDRVRQF